MPTIYEGKVIVKIPASDKLSRKMPVFYNPMMKHNRDITVLLLKAIPEMNLKIGLPLAGSGVRGIRFLKELPARKIKKVYFNDKDKVAVRYIRKNLVLNKVSGKNIEISNRDASIFLRQAKGFDYIDIDPFGSPNPFLEAAVQSISRNGILGVTATDTAALCGAYKKACVRKYWAEPMHNYRMHEIGLRILIRKVQLVGGQYSKALTPIFSYSKDHHMRAFFRVQKGKQYVDKLLKEHGFFEGAGPVWLGKLWDRKTAGSMERLCQDEELKKFLHAVSQEAKISAVGFYDLHKVCKRFMRIPSTKEVIRELKRKGYAASPTHFSNHGVRSNVSEQELVKVSRGLLS